MSHMPPSCPPPRRRIPSSPSKPPHPVFRWLSAPPPADAPCLRQSTPVLSFYLIPPSIPLSSISKARQRLPPLFPPPFPPFFLSPLSLFLSRLLVHSTKVSLFLSASVVWCGGRKWEERRLHLLPHLGISRVAHLPYIERSEGETTESSKRRERGDEERERQKPRD